MNEQRPGLGEYPASADFEDRETGGGGVLASVDTAFRDLLSFITKNIGRVFALLGILTFVVIILVVSNEYGAFDSIGVTPELDVDVTID